MTQARFISFVVVALASAGAVAQPSPAPSLSLAESLGSTPGKHRDSFWIGTSVVLKNPINLSTGKFPGVGLSYSLNLSFRITERVMGCVDLSVATPLTAFNPNPSFGVGPAFLVARRFVVNPEVLYSPSFYYDGSINPAPPPNSPARAVNHSVGASVALAFLRPPVIIAPVVIASYNVTQDQWLLVFALKVGFMLAAL